MINLIMIISCVLMFIFTSIPRDRLWVNAIVIILSVFNIILCISTNDIEMIWLYAIVIIVVTIHSLVIILKHEKKI